MDNLVQEEIADTTEEESDVDEEFDIIFLPSPKIKSYREVIQSLEDSQIFLDSRGCLEAATHASSYSLINLRSCLSSCIQFYTDYFRSVCVTMETLYSCF